MAAHGYELRVRGVLGPVLRAAFEGATIATADGDTLLRGVAWDQAALHGALLQVQALGLELVEVHRLADSSPGMVSTPVDHGASPF